METGMNVFQNIAGRRKPPRQAGRTAAFTFLELIAVIIILGVLAGLAMTRFSNAVDRSYLPEALTVIRFVRGAVERCSVMTGGDVCACVTGSPWYRQLGLENPDTSPNARFNYQMAAVCAGAVTQYQLRADRKDGAGGVLLDYTRNTAGSDSFTITGDGVYDGFLIEGN